MSINVFLFCAVLGDMTHARMYRVRSVGRWGEGETDLHEYIWNIRGERVTCSGARVASNPPRRARASPSPVAGSCSAALRCDGFNFFFFSNSRGTCLIDVSLLSDEWDDGRIIYNTPPCARPCSILLFFNEKFVVAMGDATCCVCSQSQFHN